MRLAYSIFAFLVLTTLQPALVSAVDRTPDPRAGLKVFWAKGCIHCHPVLGQQRSGGPDLSRSTSIGDGFQLAAAMWNHAPQMWQRIQQQHIDLPTFELEEMEDLFAFLGMVQSFDAPGNAKAGRQLYQSKQCANCHAIRGQGSGVGPDLYAVSSNRNPVAWVATMWNHASGMFQQLSKRGTQFPGFEGTEMVDLQAYIRSVGGVEQGPQEYLLPPSAQRGAALFQTKHCINCHSLTGRGEGIGPDLRRAGLPHRYGEMATVMWNHAPQMYRVADAVAVAYPQFQPQELADLLAYLNAQSTTPQGSAAAGAKTFIEKGCGGCHPNAPGEQGVGPHLGNLQQALTPASIARTMWNHGPAMLQQMEQASIPWPLFTTGELADTLAYLRSIQQKTGESVSRQQQEGGSK